jgi:D-sedoheptulose 7-phosphate isomerase
VLRGLVAARSRGLVTAAFTGERGLGMAARADIPLVIPSASTARIQEGYMLLGHVMCELVEQTIFAPVRAAA